MSQDTQPTHPAPFLEGRRVAIITGASQGIGAGLAAAFREAGYAVVGTARSIARSDEPDFLTVQGDIAEAATAQRVVEQTLERFGRIDSLINNAGIYISKPFTDYSIDDFAAIIAVNLTGFFHITQRAIRHMVTQGSGHIVNVSTSLVDHADSTRPSALTSLTKGGLVAVARSLAVEIRRHAGSESTRSRSASSRPPCTIPPATRAPPAFTLLGGWARSATSLTVFSISNGPHSSRGSAHIDGGQAAGG